MSQLFENMISLKSHLFEYITLMSQLFEYIT